MNKEDEKRSSSESEDSDGSSSSSESSTSSRGSSASRDTKDNRSAVNVLKPGDRVELEGKTSITRKRSRSKSIDQDAGSGGNDQSVMSSKSAAERISPPRSRRRSRSPQRSSHDSVENITRNENAGSSADPKVCQVARPVSLDKKTDTPVSDKEKSRSRSPRVRNRGSLSGGYERRRRRSSSPRRSSSSPRKRSRSKSRSRSRSNSRVRNQRRRYRSRSPPNRERHNLRLNSSYRYQRSDFRGRGQGARRFYNRNSYSRPYRYQGLPYRRRRSRSGSYPRDAHGFKGSSRRTRSPSRSPDRRNRRSGSRTELSKTDSDRRISSVPREGSPLSLVNIHKKVPETRKREVESDSDSTSSLSSSSSGGKKQKKRSKKVKKEKHKKKSKKGKHSKKKRKSSKTSRKDRKSKRSSLENVSLTQAADISQQETKTFGGAKNVHEARKFAPKSQAEWEKEQSIVRKEIDEQTGRVRLVRGAGEIIESIVTKQQHREINRTATKQDGDQFQVQLIKKLK